MYLRNSRITAGDALLRSSLKSKVESLGRDNPEVIRWRNLQAAVLVQRNRFKEAEPVLQELIASLKARSDPDDPELSVALHSLGLIYKETARLPEALDCFTRSGAIAAKIKDPGRVRPQLCAADVHMKLQHYQQAEDLYRSILLDIGTQLGSDHPLMADALSEYSGALRRMDRKDEAKKLQKEAKSIIAARPREVSGLHTVDVSELAPNGYRDQRR